MKVPLTKINIDDDTIKAANVALKSGQWILGKKTQEFESKFAKFCNVKYAVCVSSGTTALFLAMKSFDVKKGDEIIVPSFSFIATASTVSMCGATPKFVDVNMRNFTMDPNDLANKITQKTVGIIPVHLFGHASDMDPINKIAKKTFYFCVRRCSSSTWNQIQRKTCRRSRRCCLF